MRKNGHIGGWFNGPDFTRGQMVTSHTVIIGEWTHIVVVLDTNIGTTWYVNGNQDMFYDMTPTGQTAHPGIDCPPVYIGSKTSHGNHGINGAIDDIKYWYRKLTPTGE